MNYVIEFVFSMAMFINALLFVPQIIRLLKKKNSEDVSFITFFGFLLIQLATLLHGAINHDILLVLGSGLSMVACGSVAILVVWYRLRS